jgi:UDP-2,4-diacetamido-2,4,6-trideoxy-beta-L-altropyranose hydrolase
MQVVFRADASVDIGTGHVMRCLTLADALSQVGARCTFICRDRPGNLATHIRARGHAVVFLSSGDIAFSQFGHLSHAAWLGTSQAEDARDSIAFLRSNTRPDWLVVDHYALDAEWEAAVRPHAEAIMVIDDLADRRHVCDLLLDQTYGRDPSAYADLLPADARLLCGARFALLRPEFYRFRSYSIERRLSPILSRVLISLGGVDKPNATLQVLQTLAASALPPDTKITVVMGTSAPWLQEVSDFAAQMTYAVEVLVGVDDMARLMAEADFAIGAAGATTWERCSLGLPTAMVVLAENQRFAADCLASSGAAVVLELDNDFATNLHGLIARLVNEPNLLKSLSESALTITEGKGCQLVMAVLRS